MKSCCYVRKIMETEAPIEKQEWHDIQEHPIFFKYAQIKSPLRAQLVDMCHCNLHCLFLLSVRGYRVFLLPNHLLKKMAQSPLLQIMRFYLFIWLCIDVLCFLTLPYRSCFCPFTSKTLIPVKAKVTNAYI